ncbi:hypothetical protein V5F77_28875 [Xanthobacter sp. DSM 24535]|uniref:hypothetical protein n=1 Tax=Roseixanthobacter psychrophilus TaxID=3119917 RepID=UPI0037267685
MNRAPITRRSAWRLVPARHGQAGEFIHWAKVAAEVARISPHAQMDLAVVQAIVDNETRRAGDSRDHSD